MTLLIFQPTKDECGKCLSYRVGKFSAGVYGNNLLINEAVRIDKWSYKDDLTGLAFSKDLQALLLCSKPNAASCIIKNILFTILQFLT